MNRVIGIFSAAFVAALVAGCGDSGARSEAKGDAAAQAHDPVKAAKYYAASAAQGETNRVLYVKLAVSAAAAGDLPMAKDAVEKACAIDPSSAEVVLATAQIAYLERDYVRALALFSSVADTKALPASLRSQAYAGAAVADLASGRADAARIRLWRALRLDRRSAAAWYHLGYLSRNAYHAMAAAVEQFEMAARLEGDTPRARDIRKSVLPALRESIRLRSVGTKGASGRDPNAAAALVAEGEKAFAKQRLRTADMKFEQAYRKDPLSYAAAWNFAKSLAHAKGADPVKTLAVFRSAEDAKPTSQVGYRTAARYALQAGLAGDAVAILNRALSHDFEDTETLELYVQALAKAGKAREAAVYRAFRGEL